MYHGNVWPHNADIGTEAQSRNHGDYTSTQYISFPIIGHSLNMQGCSTLEHCDHAKLMKNSYILNKDAPQAVQFVNTPLKEHTHRIKCPRVCQCLSLSILDWTGNSSIVITKKRYECNSSVGMKSATKAYPSVATPKSVFISWKCPPIGIPKLTAKFENIQRVSKNNSSPF